VGIETYLKAKLGAGAAEKGGWWGLTELGFRSERQWREGVLV